MGWISGIKARLNGIRAEREALAYLMANQLELLEKNYRCKAGEVDLIMRAAGTLVFVEVKSRRGTSHGHAAEYVDNRKHSKVASAAAYYLQSKGINPLHCDYRIDVVAIDANKINWFKAV